MTEGARHRRPLGIIASTLLVLAVIALASCGGGSGSKESSGPKLVAHDYYTGVGASVATGVGMYSIDDEVKGGATDYLVKVVGSNHAYVLIEQSASTMHRELPDKKFVKKSPVTYRYHCKQKCNISIMAQLWCKPGRVEDSCAPGSEIPKGRIEVWIWQVK